jgi:hypothetical protein
MSILNKHLVFVNEQVSVQGRLAKKYGNDERRAALHTATRDSLLALLADLAEADHTLDSLEKQSAATQPVQASALILRMDELQDLPEELLKELSEGAIPDKVDTAILGVIQERSGFATLDQLLVGLYRATGDVWKRPTLTSKLYRMAQKGSIFQVPGKKGLYSIRRVTEEEARQLFGAEPEQQQLV